MPWDCCSTCARYGSEACQMYDVFNYGEDNEMIMPKSDCQYGYPDAQLREIFTQEQFKRFSDWMVGQTISDCAGSVYDHELKSMVPSGCGPHGWVYYSHDIARFLRGLPVID